MSDFRMYVIRHGQTDYNRDGRLQGARDIPLNATGRAQAAGLGKALAALPGFDPDAYDWVASPLVRARETMELVRSNAGLDPHAYRTDPLLIEVSFGDWEGYTLEEVEAGVPGSIARREAAKWNFLPPGETGESYEMMAQRVDAFLAKLDRPTVCVAHGGIIRALFNRVGGVAGDVAALLDVPQDRILRVEGNSVDWV
jgi:Fructose-2,6-bisphosphatase